MGAVAAMDPRYCGVKTKRGSFCRAPAGRGTPHSGVGPCSKHGGCLPDVVRKYARIQAQNMALEWGIEADVDPFSGIMQSVRMAYGAVAAFRSRVPKDAEPNSPEVMAWMAAQKQAAQIAKLAIDAGIAEREVRLMERLADSIAQAFEDAVAPFDDARLPADVRQELSERFAAALELREGSDVIEGRESTG